MSSADLAVVAAFTAAGLSLVNVVITTRMARRGQREQWRREQERPIVARCLTLSRTARDEWGAAAVAKRDMNADDPWLGSVADQHRKKGVQLMRDLQYEVAQLDLLASRAVRQAAWRLVRTHEEPMVGLLGKAGEDNYQVRMASDFETMDMEAKLVELTRVDLGLRSVSTLSAPHPRSLLGKLLAREENNSLLGRLFGLTRARE
jgi:hypothetical protein